MASWRICVGLEERAGSQGFIFNRSFVETRDRVKAHNELFVHTGHCSRWCLNVWDNPAGPNQL